MRTPPLRRRVVQGGSLVIAAVLLAFDAFVFLSVRQGLEGALEELLAVRADAAAGLAEELAPEELADGLAGIGVPAAVETPDGQRFVSEPTTPRVGEVSPATAVAHPRVSRAVDLPQGGVVAVFATRAGVDAALRHLLAAIAVGTLAAIALAYTFLRWATVRALAPLDEVVATAERITAGARGERLEPEQTASELGRLATAFDAMLDSLEEAVAVATAEQEHSRRFLADAAHQLRTPITGIRATAELLLHEEGPEVRERLVTNALRESARAGRLITELLHIARLDRDDSPERSAVDLLALCNEELDRARSLSPHLDIDLVASGGPVPPVIAVAEDVEGAVANLVDNARRHALQRMQVRIEHGGAFVTIRVDDDGPGIPEGSEERIFERFCTLDGKGGSGLGLPIARAVAQAHGGDLVHQDGAFVMWLPVAHEVRGSE